MRPLPWEGNECDVLYGRYSRGSKQPVSGPDVVRYLNTQRLAAVPFILDVSIRFAASPIEAHEPTT